MLALVLLIALVIIVTGLVLRLPHIAKMPTTETKIRSALKLSEKVQTLIGEKAGGLPGSRLQSVVDEKAGGAALGLPGSRHQSMMDEKVGRAGIEEKWSGGARFGCMVQDVLYEYVCLSELALKFVNTPEFQGLRDLRQLGSTFYVFPSANHTRFEHSIGVYHLAGKMVSRLLSDQPDLPIPPGCQKERFVEIVRLAGLLHDIGHFAGSHTFDDRVAPHINVPHHEERGVQMIRSMAKKYAIPINGDELELICGLILGSETIGPEWVRGIIHNKECELDADKLDYLCRDSRSLFLTKPIQVERLLLNMKVLPTTKASADAKDEKCGGHLRVCFARKVFLQVYDVFQTRYRLFREVYRHRAVLGVEEMISEVMILLKPVLEEWIKKSIRPTDAAINSIPHWLPFVPPNILGEQQKTQILEIFNSIRSRRLYKLRQVETASEATLHVRLALSALNEDPVEKVWFYDKNDSVHHIPLHQVTKLLGSSPRIAAETIHYQIVK